MKYAANYDIGDRKRESGINEDSVVVTVLEDGHRSGYRSSDGRDEPLAGGVAEAAPGGDPRGADGAGDAGDPEDGKPAPDDVTGESPGGDELDAGDDGTASGRASDDGAEPGDGFVPEAPEGLPANRSAGLFVLADGAGGHDAGDAASYIATTVVAEQLAGVLHRAVRARPDAFDIDIDEGSLPTPPDAAEIRGEIEAAINEAHAEIIRYAATTGQQAYTTVVAGVYVDGRLHYGWVGDSRAYVINTARQKIELLTKDHAVVEELYDEGVIDAVEAHVHPQGNEITRALGGSQYESPDRAEVAADTSSVDLYAEDVVLFTSDGLIDAQTDAPLLYDRYQDAADDEAGEVAEQVLEAVVTDDEIRNVLLGADSLEDAARRYVDLSNERGGKDNISVVLFADPVLPPTPDPERSALPVRAYDPDEDIDEWRTLIKEEAGGSD